MLRLGHCGRSPRVWRVSEKGGSLFLERVFHCQISFTRPHYFVKQASGSQGTMTLSARLPRPFQNAATSPDRQQVD